jgi:uncharacterized protein YprB with RNaseH-like and TPR domain
VFSQQAAAPSYADGDALLRATFQLVPGLGPTRERGLWQAGVTDWDHFTGNVPAAAGIVPQGLGEKLARATAAATTALAARDLPALAAALPTREMWRLFGAFADRAVYLDIETDSQNGGDQDGITAIGIYDHAGPRILLAGRDLHHFPQLVPRDCLLVTFNGACFDVPVLRRVFRDWEAPAAHIDLRPVWTRLGQWGGLKLIEDRVGIGRPDHLRGLTGSAAVWLWRDAQNGNRRALQRFAEYNLYDTINLRTLLVMAHNQLAADTGLDVPPVPSFARGDVLYDVSKVLLAL